jgi:PAS domain S-box-containing protein
MPEIAPDRMPAETALPPIVCANAARTITYFSPAAERIFGYGGRQIIGEPFSSIVAEHHHPTLESALDRLTTADLTPEPEERVQVDGLRRDDTEFPLELALASWTANGEIGYTGVLSDIVERTPSQAEREAERFFSLSGDLLCTANMEGQFTRANPAFQKALGWSQGYVVGRPYIEFVHPDDIERTNAESAALASAEHRTLNFENRYRCSDGSYRWLLWAASSNVEDGLIYCTAKDITERKAAEEDFRASEERFRTAFDASPMGIEVVDEEGRFAQVNEAFCRLTGFSAEELRSKTVAELTHPADLAKTNEILRRLRAQEGSRMRHETRYLTKSGGFVWAAMTGTLVRDERSGSLNVLGLIEDLTDRKNYDELAAARDQALAASRSKSEFLANMSHEIRTPMNGVIGMTELLLETELTNRQRDYAEAINTSGGALLAILEDILDVSRVEAGKLELEQADFSLGEVVGDVCDLLAGGAHRKDVELAWSVDDDLPPTVHGDAGRVRQVLVNLIGNAIKFTDAGEVVVTARRSGEEKPERLIEITVADTGPGIDSERLLQLFEPFVQADASTTRRFGGTGLGLTISRRLAELMGGGITAASTPGEGSVFRFTAALTPSIQRASDPVSASEDALNAVRILIADDNETNRHILMGHLASWRADVVSASSGSEALRLLARSVEDDAPFQIAILDMKMPDFDGWQVAQLVRNDPLLDGVALVLLSSTGEEEHDAATLERCTRVKKPVRRARLLEALRRAIGAEEQDLARAADTAADGAGAPPEGVTILVVEDHAINQALVTEMLVSRGHRVEVADNGLAALEALSKGRYDLVFMDCQMPEMDGFEATAEIRRREARSRRTPIVAMTANSMKGDRDRCIASGMDGYLSKPFRGPQLDAVLARWLGSRHIGPSATPVRVRTEGVLLDAAVLDGLLRTTPRERLREIVADFRADAGSRLVQLREAAAAGDRESMGRTAHMLRGSSAMLGAGRVSETCARIESAASGATAELDDCLAELEDALRLTGQRLEAQLASVAELPDATFEDLRALRRE